MHIIAPPGMLTHHRYSADVKAINTRRAAAQLACDRSWRAASFAGSVMGARQPKTGSDQCDNAALITADSNNAARHA